MSRTLFTFSFFGMPTKVKFSVFLGLDAIALILALIAKFLFGFSVMDAIVVGIVGALLHGLSGVLHQYGHFLMARRSGYPSNGLIMWWILGTTLYPEDEGALPPQIHIQRASGGALMSGLVALAVALVLFGLNPQGAIIRFLLGWVLLESLLVFTLGALLPPIEIGTFTNDGAVILREWRKMRSQGQ